MQGTQEKRLEVKTGIKEPANLSPRIQWLRDYYFKGRDRAWNNRQVSFTTGEPWDVVYNELNYHIVPETYAFFRTFTSSYLQIAEHVDLPEGFWSMGLPERRAWFNKKVMLDHVPQEILPGDLIAGARFNIHTSLCLDKNQTRQRAAVMYGKHGLSHDAVSFHNHGFGNAGPTAGHIIPDYGRVLEHGFKAIDQELDELYGALSKDDKAGERGAQLRAMKTSCSLPRELAERYRDEAIRLAAVEPDAVRRAELERMSDNLSRVPWEGARDVWEAVQSLWLTHMLVMSDENYPGPGVSFGNLDRMLDPFWQISKADGMSREMAKEILECFWIHANTAYDSMIMVGNQGITAGFGQLFNLSGIGPGGVDATSDTTFLLLEALDDMSPILEPKPNVRLHRGSPDALLDKVVDMISTSQGAPFLLNFDERSMAGMMRESKVAGLEKLINTDTVNEYASVGCLENTMVGNDRSGTVDCNLNLLKAVELTMGNGMPLVTFTDTITGIAEKPSRQGPKTGDPRSMATFEEFWTAYATQTRHIIRSIVQLYNRGDELRASFHPTPYLSTLVRGCAAKGKDVTQGGPEINFVTIEGVTFATTVDSLLAIRFLVYEKKFCTMDQLVQALKDNWAGHEVLQARAKNQAPKYGRDDDVADDMAIRVMDLWADETWKHRTPITGRRYRPGMLSWNYWVGDGYILPASPDGRPKDQFLSNAICPSNGADLRGPTANSNSVGKVLGGRAPVVEGKPVEEGDWQGYYNSLPNGASHTISFNPSLIRKAENKEKFKAFLRGYTENGGTALQVNMLDPEILRDAQKRPGEYRHLLVRVTGYNAYFTSIGKELQDEVISRIAHEKL